MNHFISKLTSSKLGDYYPNTFSNQPNLTKSASISHFGTSTYKIGEYPLQSYIKSPGYYYDISFYPNLAKFPMNKNSISPEVMKMQLLEAKLHNLEQSTYEDKEQIKSMIQYFSCTNPRNLYFLYCFPNYFEIQKERQREELKKQVYNAKLHLSKTKPKYKSILEFEPSFRKRKRIKSKETEEDEREAFSIGSDASIKIINKEKEKEINKINKKTIEDLNEFRKSLLNLQSQFDQRINTLDLQTDIGLCNFKEVLKNTGNQKLISSLNKIMNNKLIDANEANDDLSQAINKLPFLMEQKIQENEERKKIEKEKRKEKEKNKQFEEEKRKESQIMEKEENKSRLLCEKTEQEIEKLKTIEEKENAKNLKKSNNGSLKNERQFYKLAKFENKKKRNKIIQENENTKQENLPLLVPFIKDNEYIDIDYIQQERENKVYQGKVPSLPKQLKKRKIFDNIYDIMLDNNKV